MPDDTSNESEKILELLFEPDNAEILVELKDGPKTICSCSGLTIAWRLIECIGIFFIVGALGIHFVGFFNLLSMYPISVILGSLSMSPGGLGVTEGSFAGLLTLEGLDLQTALAIAVIVRFFTLWFAILVGFISLKLIDVIRKSPEN